MMKKILACFLACIYCTILSSQDNDFQISLNSSVHATVAYDYEEREEFSYPGIDYQLNLSLDKKYGLQFRVGFNSWNKNDRLSIPGVLGIYYNAISLKNHNIQLIFNGGGSLEIGNDYAGGFGVMESGIQIMPKHDSHIAFSFTWAQHMAFHSSPNSILRFRVGYVF